MGEARKPERNIHKGHRERIKLSFRENGLSCMNDLQTLEFMLFFAVPNGDTNPTAHRLLEKFGSFAGVLEAEPNELTSVKGIGDHAAVLIKLFQQVSKRYLICSSLDPRESLTDTGSLVRYFEGIFLGCTNEELYAMALDDGLRLIKAQKVAEGLPDSVNASFRILTGFAVKNNCTRIVIAHNHPIGLGRPSKSDVAVTKELVALFSKIDLVLLDHIIVGRDGGWSMLSALSHSLNDESSPSQSLNDLLCEPDIW